MTVLGRRGLNGKPQAYTAPTGSAPSQVGSLTPGTPTANSVPVTYTAAAGATSYAGYTSPHGANTWTLNAGTFGSSGGMFTGLSASTNYDLRIVATNAYGSSTTDYLASVTTASIGSGGLIVYISEDYYSGDAKYKLAIDGTPFGGTTDGTYGANTRTATVLHSSGSAEAVSLGTLAAGSHTLSVTFLNDLYGGSPTTDRNLWVNYATYNGAPVRFASSMIGSTGQVFNIVFAVGSDGALTAETTEGYVEPAPAYVAKANAYRILLDASTAAPGGTVTGKVYANDLASGEVITLTPTGATSISVTATNGSAGPFSFSFAAPSAGEVYVAGTNNGTLYDRRAAPLNVFSASSGTARTITAKITSGLNMQPHQFDTLTGSSGFTFTDGSQKGVGEVWIDILTISGVTGGLFAKLADADSSGATDTAGTGTYLHSSPVQVYGPVSAAGTKRLLIPASKYLYRMDVASDAAFTNPVRLPQSFQVGLICGDLGRSQEAAHTWGYPDSSTPTSETTKVLVRYKEDERYGRENGDPWYRQDGASGDPNGASAGAQAFGRFVASQLGVALALTGQDCSRGGGIDAYVNHNGSATAPFQQTIGNGGFNSKLGILWAASLAGWDGAEGESYYEVQTRILAMPDWFIRTYTSLDVIGIGLGCTGRPEADGSSPLGPARLQQTVLRRIEPVNPMVVSKENHAWAGFKSDHGNRSSARLYVQTSARQFFSAILSVFGGLQTRNRGPDLATTGTIVNGSRVGRIPVKLNGGTALENVVITQVAPDYSVSRGTASAGDMASLLSVYRRGGYAGKSKAIAITGVGISTSSVTPGYDAMLEFTLTGSSGLVYADASTDATFPSDGLSVHYGADLNASGGTGWTIVNTTGEPPAPSRLTMITDNQVSGPWEFGRHLRPRVDIAVSVV